jgi:hypothetical protein
VRVVGRWVVDIGFDGGFDDRGDRHRESLAHQHFKRTATGAPAGV